MERERLTQLMAEPALVAKQDLAGLEELATRYPWFSAAHLLLAVGEHGAGEVMFDERARTAAAHLPDRSVLFDLVQAPPGLAELAVAPVVVDPAPWVMAAPVAVEPIPAPVPVIEAVAPLPVPVIVPSVAEAPAVLPTPPEEALAPPPPAEPLPAASTEQDVDPLDLLIRQSALASVYELIAEQGVVPVTSETAPDAPPPAMPMPLPEPAPIVAAAKAHTGKLRFTDWLSMDASDQAVAAPPSPAPQAPMAADWLRGPVAPVEEPPVALEQAAAPKAPVVEPLVLIDRFIRQEHPEPVKRAAFFTPQQAAKRSLEDHAELVTETLARIYEKQGNVAKAIAAYRRLAERQPEKSAYFLGLAAGLEARGGKDSLGADR